MTPEERNLVMELFNRLATLENTQRDPEAERLIQEGLRYAPNAPYALVQTVLVQDEALKRAEARIRELEAGPAEPEGGFLGSMRDSLFGRPEARGSVPSVRPGESERGMSPAWQAGSQPLGTGSGAGSIPPSSLPGGPGGGYAGPGAGGSFLGTAAAAAAGTIGGSLLLGSIRSLMGPQGTAHAAYDPRGSNDPAPWSGGSSGGDLGRQVGLDDIGRSSSAESGERRAYGAFDPGQAEHVAADSGDDAHPEDDFDFDEDADDFDDTGEEE